MSLVLASVRSVIALASVNAGPIYFLVVVAICGLLVAIVGWSETKADDE